MTPDKMLSEAEKLLERLKAARAMSGRFPDPDYREQTLSAQGLRDVLDQCIKLAIPKPRQDAGRPEFWGDAQLYEGRSDEASAKRHIVDLQAYALTLEAKPQPDAGALDPHLLTFALAMQGQLEANAGRGDWKEGIGSQWLHEGITRNLADIDATGPSQVHLIRRTAADIANFALMYWATYTKQAPLAQADAKEGA